MERLTMPGVSRSEWGLFWAIPALAVAFVVSYFFAPRMDFSRMQTTMIDNVPHVDALGWVSSGFSGAYAVTVRDANSGFAIAGCKGGADHHYAAGQVYGTPQPLVKWWLTPRHGDIPCNLTPGMRIFVETEYTLPGYLWGVLPPRTVIVTTAPMLID